MKKITELTEMEIYNLTKEDLDVMIKYAKIEAGVKLIEKPKVPIYNEIPAKDLIVYNVNGIDVYFKNITLANKILELLASNTTNYGKLEYNSEAGYDNKYLDEGKISYITELNINTMMVYSKELYHSIKLLFNENTKLKKQYESELKEYDTYLSENGYIEEEIINKFNEVKDKFYRVERYTRKFRDDYMTVTDDESIAIAFMDKAYSLTEEQKQYILINYKNIL